MSTTIQQLLHRARAELDAASGDPGDALVLLSWVLGCSRAALYAHADSPVTPNDTARLHAALARRCAGEPVAYIVGRREFYGLDLAVTPDTLIPRPATETLVERALHHLPRDSVQRVADLGTGSGAVALAIAKARPRSAVTATDFSTAALAVAADNARRLGITNVKFLHSDWFDALANEPPFDMIVSNPPYIEVTDPHLEQGDLRFEPRTALAAGADGLDALRHLLAHAPARLCRGGWLLVEHGYEQGAAVVALFKAAGFTDCKLSRDLAGQDRVVEGRVG